jgi:hypothetical protein
VLRVVLAVVLAVAVLAVALPVVERARTQRSADLAEGSLARVAERATGLAATDEATGGGAARRVVSVTVPAGGPGTTRVAYLAVGGAPDCATPRDASGGDVVAYRLRGGPTRVRHLPVDLRVRTDGRLRDDDDPLVLRDDARLVLSLVGTDGGSRVVVERDRQTTTDNPDVGGQDAESGGLGAWGPDARGDGLGAWGPDARGDSPDGRTSDPGGPTRAAG